MKRSDFVFKLPFCSPINHSNYHPPPPPPPHPPLSPARPCKTENLTTVNKCIFLEHWNIGHFHRRWWMNIRYVWYKNSSYSVPSIWPTRFRNLTRWPLNWNSRRYGQTYTYMDIHDPCNALCKVRSLISFSDLLFRSVMKSVRVGISGHSVFTGHLDFAPQQRNWDNAKLWRGKKRRQAPPAIALWSTDITWSLLVSCLLCVSSCDLKTDSKLAASVSVSSLLLACRLSEGLR